MKSRVDFTSNTALEPFGLSRFYLQYIHMSNNPNIALGTFKVDPVMIVHILCMVSNCSATGHPHRLLSSRQLLS